MSLDTHRPTPDADAPLALAAHETGLSPQRFRELIAWDDAYVRSVPACAGAPVEA